jgi:putative IMPACT (imprinted ancient) family translation regulator
MHNSIINYKTENFQKTKKYSKKIENSIIILKIKNNKKLKETTKVIQKIQKIDFSHFSWQNIKSSGFYISLWNFEKQDFVQTTYGY